MTFEEQRTRARARVLSGQAGPARWLTAYWGDDWISQRSRVGIARYKSLGELFQRAQVSDCRRLVGGGGLPGGRAFRATVHFASVTGRPTGKELSNSGWQTPDLTSQAETWVTGSRAGLSGAVQHDVNRHQGMRRLHRAPPPSSGARSTQATLACVPESQLVADEACCPRERGTLKEHLGARR